MIHRLPSFFFNAKKRVLKHPKIYLRDSGIAHRLLRFTNYDLLLDNPYIGASWEAYVVEQIYQTKHPDIDLFYYRTHNRSEMDLVLTRAGIPVASVEIKYSNSPSLSKGYHESVKDLETTKNFVVVPKGDSYSITNGSIACGLSDFLTHHLPNV